MDDQNEARQKLEQGTASLAARAQQLRHDREMALALAQLAADQQAARDTIAEAARDLERPVASEADRSSQATAAQALQQAQQQFAAAQMATGEGAADVSGQQEVANQPIREGLQIASQLSQRLFPKLPGEETSAEEAQQNQDKNGRSENGHSSTAANPKSKIEERQRRARQERRRVRNADGRRGFCNRQKGRSLEGRQECE
ncbi:MAG: hypothetical protein JF612_02390 [Planctomycetia bacterium]|nr:hypothetical protein [Planctomycetia bacterium]